MDLTKDPFEWWEKNGRLDFRRGDVRIYNVEGEDYLFIGQTIYASTKELGWYVHNVYNHVRGNVLEIGLGLGCASRLICKAPKIRHLLTLEANEDVIGAFGKPLKHHHIIHTDVNEWIKQVPTDFPLYDLIFVDHYTMGDDDIYPELQDLAGKLSPLLKENGRMIYWIDEHAPEEDQEFVRSLWLTNG